MHWTSPVGLGDRGLPPGIRILKRCDFDDYVAWYLARELRKGRRFRCPRSAAARHQLMERAHAGKLLPGISDWQWWQGRIDSPQALAALLIPLSSQSVEQGLIDPTRPRTLGVAVERLGASQFFERTDGAGASPHPFRRYYQRLAHESLALRGSERLVLRSLTPAERRTAPRANDLYLLDGVGRALPYLSLVQQGRLRFRPIDVFVACANSIVFTWPAVGLRHQTGELSRSGTSWLCVPDRHRPGHALFGPYVRLPGVRLAACFRLRAEPGPRVVTLDVFDARERRVLASHVLMGGSEATLPFANAVGNLLEFRAYWHGDRALELERIDLRIDA